MNRTLGSRFADLTELSSATLGGRALWSSDAFFASHDNLVKPHPAVWDADRYTERGKWMDGWEPRRRRHPGHDTAIVKLGAAGALAGVDIDTSHFLGNHAPFASLDVTTAPADATADFLRDQAEWTTVLDQTRLERGGSNVFSVRPLRATHVRLHIYPAGGVARLRVYGRPDAVVEDRCDLASATLGGKALACSDSFFSRMDNLLRPDVAKDMGDGWETRRSAFDRQDWVVVALAQPGLLDTIRVHTRHFKGNFPTGVRLEGLYWPGGAPHALASSSAWTALAPDTPLGADQAHDIAVTEQVPVTHLRMTILSDGGVSRLRAFGRPTTACPADTDALLTWLNELSAEACAATLHRCCGSTRWARRMAAHGRFGSRTELHGLADHHWWDLADGDWHEAFTHHPRIGADVAKLREKFAPTASWSAGEQSGVAAADEGTLEALAQGNRDYEARFGFLFIVCATGKSASEMLHLLQERIDNDPAAELRIAAGEQAKITHLRLEKL